MELNVLVVATREWKSRKEKHDRIVALMNLNRQFGDITFTTVHRQIVPKVVKKRIDEQWFEDNLSKEAKDKGFNHVIFSFSQEEGKAWGLESGVRGVNYNDKDYFGESWVRSDENSVARFKDGTSRDLYEKVIPHEIGHELKNKGLTALDIHRFDFKNEINNIEGFYRALNLQTGGVGHKISLVRNQIFNLLKGYTTPLPNHWTKITQTYGVPNSRLYPRTGHHIGVDFGTPIGTPFLAPTDCEIVKTGNVVDTLGFWAEIRCTDFTMFICHLDKIPKKGTYKRGKILCYTGNSGRISTGPHAHVEGWHGHMDRSKLSPTNWRTLTFDITTKIK